MNVTYKFANNIEDIDKDKLNNGDLIFCQEDKSLSLKMNDRVTTYAINDSMVIGIEDAPSNDLLYVRKNNNWSPVSNLSLDDDSTLDKVGVVLEDAPMDGKPYVRIDGKWAEFSVDSIITTSTPKVYPISSMVNARWKVHYFGESLENEYKPSYYNNGNGYKFTAHKVFYHPFDGGRIIFSIYTPYKYAQDDKNTSVNVYTSSGSTSTSRSNPNHKITVHYALLVTKTDLNNFTYTNETTKRIDITLYQRFGTTSYYRSSNYYYYSYGNNNHNMYVKQILPLTYPNNSYMMIDNLNTLAKFDSVGSNNISITNQKDFYKSNAFILISGSGSNYNCTLMYRDCNNEYYHKFSNYHTMIENPYSHDVFGAFVPANTSFSTLFASSTYYRSTSSFTSSSIPDKTALSSGGTYTPSGTIYGTYRINLDSLDKKSFYTISTTSATSSFSITKSEHNGGTYTSRVDYSPELNLAIGINDNTSFPVQYSAEGNIFAGLSLATAKQYNMYPDNNAYIHTLGIKWIPWLHQFVIIQNQNEYSVTNTIPSDNEDEEPETITVKYPGKVRILLGTNPLDNWIDVAPEEDGWWNTVLPAHNDNSFIYKTHLVVMTERNMFAIITDKESHFTSDFTKWYTVSPNTQMNQGYFTSVAWCPNINSLVATYSQNSPARFYTLEIPEIW